MQTVSLCDAVTLEEAGEGFALFAQGLVLPQRKTLEQRAAEVIENSWVLCKSSQYI